MNTARFGCRQQRSRLLAYVDGSLDATDAESFEQHLDECAVCRSALEFEQLVEEVLHRDAGTDFDADFESRISAGVAQAVDAKTQERRDRSTPRRWLLAAGIVAGCATTYGLWELVRRTGDPTPARVNQELANSPEPRKLEGASDSSKATPAVVVNEPPTVGPTPEPILAPAEIEKLTRARSTMREALRVAAHSSDFAARFVAETEDLARERWPIEAMVRGAIDDAEPEIARAAIVGVKALAIGDALPAIRRSLRRPELAGVSLVALGDLRDNASLPILSQALRDPRLADFACTGLSKLGTREAAWSLAGALADPERFRAAFDSLLAMGDLGIAQLVVRADRGHVAVRDGLTQAGLPTDRQLETMLTTSGDDAVLAAAARFAGERGTGALRGLLVLLASPNHRALAIDSIVAIGGRSALDALLTAVKRGAIEVADVDSGVRRMLASFLAPEALVLAIASGDARAELLSTLAASAAGLESPTEELARLAALRTIAACSELDLRTRLTAARSLAEVNALDASIALDLTGAATLLKDADAIVNSIITAARSGVELRATDFDALSTPATSNLFERALRIGERWRTSGQAPTQDDRSALVSKFQRAIL